LTAAVLRCIIAILYIKQIETVDLKERLMAISITEASELKKAILDNFGVTLHFHDGCGGQYFTLDERNDEIKRFIESYFDKKGMTVTFIARGTQFSVGGNNACKTHLIIVYNIDRSHSRACKRLNGISAYSAYAEYRNTRAFQPVHCLFTENKLCS